jgi:hypothetical protein
MNRPWFSEGVTREIVGSGALIERRIFSLERNC